MNFDQREKDLLGFALSFLNANLPELEGDGVFEDWRAKSAAPTDEELKALYTKVTGQGW